jgi:hypothetical protein
VSWNGDYEWRGQDAAATEDKENALLNATRMERAG